jgi:hypothetical protein
MPAYPNNRHGYPFGGPFNYGGRGIGIVNRAPEPTYVGEDPDVTEQKETKAAITAMNRDDQRQIRRRRRESRLHQQQIEWIDPLGQERLRRP